MFFSFFNNLVEAKQRAIGVTFWGQIPFDKLFQHTPTVKINDLGNFIKIIIQIVSNQYSSLLTFIAIYIAKWTEHSS